MSGMTQGSTNESALGDVLVLPVALAAGVVVGVAVGTAKAGQYVYQGAVRVSKKAYGAVQEKAAEVAREQIQQMQAEIDRLSRVRGQVNVEEAIAPPEQILEASLSLETRQEAALQQFLGHLERQRDFREEYERERNLRQDVSRKIAAEIEAYRQKLKELQAQREKRKAEREARLRQTKEEQRRKYLHLVERVAALTTPAMELLYPQQVDNLRKALARQEQNLATLDQFEDLETFQELQSKAALFQDDTIRAQLLQLLEWKQQFQANPLLSGYVNNSERKRVNEKFAAKLYRAEKGQLTEQDIAELNHLQEELLEQCIRRDEERRFNDTVETAKQALRARGFRRIQCTNSSDGRYRVLTGEAEDGHRATIRVIRPGVSDEDTPHIQIETDDYTYDSEEACVQARKGLEYELESLGIYLDFEEVFTHFQGKIRQQALEALRQQLQEKYPDVQVTLVKDSLVKVNGETYQWQVGQSVSDVLGAISEALTEGEKPPEEVLPPDRDDQRLRETE